MKLPFVVASLAAALATGSSLAAVSFADRVLPPRTAPQPAIRPFVKVDAPRIALRHVRIIDGTGRPPLEDRTILLEGGRITAIDLGSASLPADVTVVDLAGRTILPGLIGMHDHMYYIARPDLDADGHADVPTPLVPQMTFSAPRLYLAAGVTTMRTTGSVEPYTDLNVKAQIDAGLLAGPHMDVTGPYLEGKNSPFIQMHQLRDAEDARDTVAFWAGEGVTSFKAYMNITRDELKAAIDEAHRHGLKLTGHLCSVSYPEAAALGIDNLEHGFWVNTQNDPGKQPDLCPKTVGAPTLAGMDADSPAARALIKTLVDAHVAITSTLPVFEPSSPDYRALPDGALATLTPQALADYQKLRRLTETAPPERKAARAKLWSNELKLERAFATAGGLLIAGPDPTGAGNVIPGWGDQRAIELLVEAGFTPVEAIRIGTLNGATYLGLADRIGSIAPGKNADLIVVRGDPSRTIADIEQVEIVFKDGIGYDSAALRASVKSRYGQY
ncbi:putative hydrolase [Sphingomonas changbaiensis NBRC 104936]|uniref:Putative hydrolase n=1 Tax=Sphingomonas changbaiensis NBRC 104936 TaxID=1219043 RepID=A0A0E9MMU0_9SPHN|nr:amidohydrolase family protein [Sphingomonas changbaiensis]GAO38741.1 putative hydrolase [Sphingomonas changbaiensis NBRC 104936]